MTIRNTLRVVSGAAVAIALFTFAWLLRFNDPGGAYGFMTDDHFFYVVRGWQILFGDLPVRDFVDHGAPLTYYVAAAVQLLFGRGTLSEIAFCVAVLAAGAVGVFLLGWRASGALLLGCAAALIHVFLGPRFYNYPKVIVYVAAIAALWAYADRPGHRRSALVAVTATVGFLFRHDHGVFIAIAFAALLLMVPLTWTRRLRHAGVFALCSALLLAPYLAFLQLNGGVANYFRTAATWAERDRDRAEVVWPGLFDNPDGASRIVAEGGPVARTIGIIRDNSVAWLFYLELALPLIAVAVLMLTRDGGRPRWPHARAKIAVVAVLTLVLDAGFLRSPLAARIADPSVPLAVLVAWLPVGLWGMFSRASHTTARRVPRLAVVAVAAVALLLLLVTATRGTVGSLRKTGFDRGIAAVFEQERDMRRRLGRAFPVSAEAAAEGDDLTRLAVYLRECTAPDDRILMQHYAPQVLALAERAFAGGHADLRPGFFEDEPMQRLTMSRLQRQHVPFAVVGAGNDLGGFRQAFPIVVRYLDSEYRVAGERELDGRLPVRLLIRKDANVVRLVPPFGWPCLR